MADLLGILAATITALAAAIRWIETRRSVDVAGVAAGFAWLALASNMCWITYGLRADVPAQLPPSAAWIAVCAYLIVRIHREGRSQTRSARLFAAAVVVIVAVAWAAPDAAGYIGGTLSIASTVPQLARLWRTRDTDGVAPIAWIFSLGIGGTWMLFGLTAGLPPVWVTNGIYVTLVLAILVAYARARATGRGNGTTGPGAALPAGSAQPDTA